MIRRRFQSWPSLRHLFPEAIRRTVQNKITRRSFLTIHQLEDRVVPDAVVVNLALDKEYTNLPPTITATIFETSSGSKIASAEYFLNEQPSATTRGTTLSATDGKFDSNTEAVFGTLASTQFSALIDGVHTISVRGLTKNGSWGPFVSIQFTKDTVNDAPVFNAFNTTPNVLKTKSVTVPVSVTDPDSTAITYSLTGDVPAWASINSTSGQITLAPGIDVAAKAYQFTIEAKDNGLFGDGANIKTASQVVTATVYAAGVDGLDLYVYGSPSADTIATKTSSPTSIEINGSAVSIVLGLAADSGEAASFNVPAGGKIVVVAGEGNDRIKVDDATLDGNLDFLLSENLLTYSLSGAEVGRISLQSVEYADLVGGNGANVFALNGWAGLGGSLAARGGTDVLSITGASGKVDEITITDTKLTMGTSVFTLSGFESLETNGITGEDKINVSGSFFKTYTNTGDDANIQITLTGANFESLINSGDSTNIRIDVSGANFNSLMTIDNSGSGVTIDIKGADFNSLMSLDNSGNGVTIDAAGANFGTLINQAEGSNVKIDVSGADFTSLVNVGDTVVIDATGADFSNLLNQGNSVSIDASGAVFSSLFSVTEEQRLQINGGADFGSLVSSDSLEVMINISGADFTTLVNGGNNSTIDLTGADFTTLVNIGNGVEIDATGADFSSLTGDTPQVDSSGADFGILANYGDGVVIDVSGAIFGTLVNYGHGANIDAGVNVGADFSSLTNPVSAIDETGADFSVLVNQGTGVTIDASGANFNTLINQTDGATAQIDVSGANFSTLVNQGDGVSIDATGANFGTLTNQAEGTSVQIDVSGANFGSLVNLGDGVSIDAAGATFQVVSSSGNGITHINVQGGAEANTVILSGNNLSGVTIDGGSGGDVFVLAVTNSTIVVNGNDGDDRFVFGNTQGLMATISGGAGDDRYLFSGSTQAVIALVEAANIGSDTLDFSSLTSGPVSIDLALTSAQVIATGLTLTLSDGLGIEHAIGTDQADVIRGNGRNNVLSGSDLLDDRMGPGPAWNGRVQYVVLDFDTFTNAENSGVAVPSAGASDGAAMEYNYTANDRQAILDGLKAEYAGYLTSAGGFLEFRTSTEGLTPGQYSTIYFNRSRFVALFNPDGTASSILQPQPGGEASEVDFRNTNLGGWATVQVNGLLGGPGQPEATSSNFITGSVWTAAHELGHLLGLRHSDAFSPIGFGINTPPGTNSFTPVYPGPAGGFQTNNHIMASPAATGFTLAAFVSDTYFGERELIKLAYTRVVPTTAGVNNLLVSETAASATGQPIELVPIDVTQGLPQGLNAPKQLAAAATTVLGFISASGQKDLYSFSGRAGDLINLDLFSRGILADRYGDTLDTVVRVLKDGVEVAHFGGLAMNDDQFEFDTSLIDLVLPADGTYTIEVSAFVGGNEDTPVDENGITADNATGYYELFVYRFDTANKSDAGDILEGRGGDDLLEGGPGNDTYVFAGTALGTDILREDVRLETQGLSDAGRDARDTLDFSGLNGSATIDLSSTSVQIVSAGNLSVQLSSGLGFEDVRLSAAGGSGTGNARANVFYDSPGNDVFNGNEADDVYYLSGGNDRVNGSKGNDVIHFGAGLTGTVSVGGGDGTDTLDFSARPAGITLNLNSTNAQAVGGGLTVVLLGVDIENAFGSAVGSNLLTGNPLNNVLIGGSANDTLTGDAGSDVLVGGEGNDNLVGGEGNDILIGGMGADRMVGSNGDDLLISGWSAYDAITYDARGVNSNLATFSAIQQVWNNGQSLQARRNVLRNETTGLLRTGYVFDDGSSDSVTGSNGKDFLLLNTVEDSNDFKPSEDLKDPLSP
jgi:Ca2+-binding RTX toxin-like protein